VAGVDRRPWRVRRVARRGYPLFGRASRHGGMIYGTVPDEETRPPYMPFLRRGQRAEVKQPTIDTPYGRSGGRQEERRRQKRLERVDREREVTELTLEERFLRLAELPPSGERGPGHWTRERCIAGLRAFHEIEGRTPRLDDFQKARHWPPSAATIWRVFGSWNSALVAAGIPVNRATGASGQRHWSDEEILEAIRQAEREGEPTSAAFRVGKRLPWIGTIEHRFGSWRVAKSLAMSAPGEGMDNH
jgi:hypothetical protein